ncbi:MAG: FKBP-type peptidyl-prolyl cis-trans isomerase [Phycisphaerales bacterium]|nr:FKBP-type peptidyl-prolyl cis-trans isomerase [Phycisphaerales bacterium]
MPSPLEAVTRDLTDEPITAVKPAPDADITRFMSAMTGMFASESRDGEPALRLAAAPAKLSQFSDALLVEIGRQDTPGAAFRVMFLHPYRRQGELRLRVFDLVGQAGLKDALTGLWAMPDALPKIDDSALTPSLDMPLAVVPSGFVGKTDRPFPTMRGGAIEMMCSITIENGILRISDAGYDASGTRVWGQDQAKPIEFKRVNAPAPKASRLEGGLVVITIVPPESDAPPLEDGGELVAHYTGWFTTGQVFDSSRQTGREPFKVRLPGPVIKGWNDGLKGMAKGERRRLIVPPELAYGERGFRGAIPPNSTLIFDVETLAVDNTKPAVPLHEPQPMNPHGGGGHGGGRPAPDQPIGNPATNSAPEKPR